MTRCRCLRLSVYVGVCPCMSVYVRARWRVRVHACAYSYAGMLAFCVCAGLKPGAGRQGQVGISVSPRRGHGRQQVNEEKIF